MTTSTVDGSGAWYPYGDTYERWQRQRPFMLGAFCWALPADRVPQRLARFKAAGLNTCICYEAQTARLFIEAASQIGLQWGCWHHGQRADIARTVEEVPGCAFIMTGDEPSRPEALKPIAELSAWSRKLFPDLPVFANLSITKIDHDLYVETCQPDIFSFDQYPLQYGGGDAETYLKNLAWGRETARKHRLPYWMYLQSRGRYLPDTEDWRSYRLPDEADMRYLVFTFLAHGGTGIQFFLYYGYYTPKATWVPCMVEDTGVPPSGAAPQEHRYENSAPSRSWYAVRDLAPEVYTVARALLNLRTKDPVAYEGTIPQGCQPFKGHRSLRSAANRQNPEEPVLVAFFNDETDEEYFMVVNLVHGLNMSKMDGVRMIQLTFDSSVEQIERLNRLTGQVETLRTKPRSGKDGRVLSIQLEGGTGDLFKWANGNPWSLRPM